MLSYKLGYEIQVLYCVKHSPIKDNYRNKYRPIIDVFFHQPLSFLH